MTSIWVQRALEPETRATRWRRLVVYLFLDQTQGAQREALRSLFIDKPEKKVPLMYEGQTVCEHTVAHVVGYMRSITSYHWGAHAEAYSVR